MGSVSGRQQGLNTHCCFEDTCWKNNFTFFSDEVNNFSQYWLVKQSLSEKKKIQAVDVTTDCSGLKCCKYLFDVFIFLRGDEYQQEQMKY